MKYLVKLLFDGDQVVGHEIKHRTSSRVLPRGGKHILVEGAKTKYPKLVEDAQGEYQIVEDAVIKLATEYKEKRVKEYPEIGDQLDAVYKTFTFLKANGADMGPDGDAYLDSINAVKNQIP